MNTSPWGLFAYAGALALLAAWLPLRGWARGAALAAAFAAAFPFAWFMRGAFGDPAYTTGLLLWAETLRRWLPARRAWAPAMSAPSALWLLLLTGALYEPYFCPECLDLYRCLGISHPVVVALLFLPVALFSLRPMRSLALVYPAVVLLSRFDLHDSVNQWDLLMDPLLALVALIVAGHSFFMRLRRRRCRCAQDPGADAGPVASV